VPGQTENEPTLGTALRAAREVAGRSVEQVSADTRIRATVVRDLESDNLSSSGGSVYARGHVKSIARSLAIDPAPLLELFDKVQGPSGALPLLDQEPLRPAATSFGGSAFAGAAAALAPERRGPRWGVALTGAAAALLAIIGIGILNQPSSPVSQAGNQNGGKPAPTPSSSPRAPAAHTPAPGSVASKPAVTGAQLRVRLVNGDSWVSISNPTATLFEGLLRNGQFKDFTDPSRLKVVVGNALAVNLNCGGRDSGPAGAPGAVRRFSCTAAGLQSL
jgi:cytoskeleton protein RodZ